ncbi:hypothetical protein PMIN04_012723 [Paraphaeosphaeria minitans]
MHTNRQPSHDLREPRQQPSQSRLRLLAVEQCLPSSLKKQSNIATAYTARSIMRGSSIASAEPAGTYPLPVFFRAFEANTTPILLRYSPSVTGLGIDYILMVRKHE